MSVYVIVECDAAECEAKHDTGAGDRREGRRWAKQDGWASGGTEDFCPQHASMVAPTRCTCSPEQRATGGFKSTCVEGHESKRGRCHGIRCQRSAPRAAGRDTARELSRAAKQAQTWLERRDRLIVEALTAGAGVREVARCAGLTHPTVLNIQRREAKS